MAIVHSFSPSLTRLHSNPLAWFLPSLLSGLQLAETNLALPDCFNLPLLTPIPSPSNLPSSFASSASLTRSPASSAPPLACPVAPLASLPPAPPSVLESSSTHPPSLAPDPSLPPLFPSLGNSNI
ncbi:hypothetical protein AMTR_s00162p00044760 [Amborella trichopoda]|uniref:Uncharacterized protein n=1 Tax=Amborella trichopoda TaxID=13333 RepID=W1PH83_AMBTC|nr:hypothetical protein AMTR_s00162p00044760 [Amborella trichopoda]